METQLTFTRSQILERLQKTIASGRAIVTAGASCGLIAQAAEAGGVDLVVVYSTGRSRMKGLPTTLLGHSNPITLSMFQEIENVVDNTPIIGGAEAGDPTYRKLPRLINDFRTTGYHGIINFPTVAADMKKAKAREHIGQGLPREAEMIALARSQDYFTMAYSWTVEQAIMNAAAGVDVQVAHAGWSAGGTKGRQDAPSIEESTELTQAIIEATWRENPDAICLAHGGSIVDPEDASFLYENSGAQGFVGASSIERLPVERAVKATVEAFKQQTVRPRNVTVGS
ncbi:phosphoenolpyruvate hydrolase family protein [Pseudarthrobacter sp. YAF2]|uniref:phosphoenolpyruvate hydrolase family protein n=1 Tax=Pseudarthrobacter sp. YAF2 TaxID=3233078 RepID=UPI003F96C18D